MFKTPKLQAVTKTVPTKAPIGGKYKIAITPGPGRTPRWIEVELYAKRKHKMIFLDSKDNAYVADNRDRIMYLGNTYQRLDDIIICAKDEGYFKVKFVPGSGWMYDKPTKGEDYLDMSLEVGDEFPTTVFDESNIRNAKQLTTYPCYGKVVSVTDDSFVFQVQERAFVFTKDSPEENRIGNIVCYIHETITHSEV